LESP
jgi:hypothetical protein